MTDQPLYITTLSGKVRRGLILNGIAAAVLTLIAGPQAFGGGHWLHLLIVCVTIPVAILAMILAARARNPLVIFKDRIVLSTLGSSAIPLDQIEALTPDSKGRPGLTLRNPTTGGLADMPILWSFIAQPQEEVISQIEQAIANGKPGES